MTYSLLQNFKNENFKKEPFPHIIIENALPNKLCNELLDNYPIKEFQQMSKFNISNERLDLFFKESKKKNSKNVWDRNLIPNCWREFMNQNTNDEFKLKLRSILEDSFKSIYQQYFPKTEDIYANITVSANSPVKKIANSVRSAHLDQPSKLYTGLYYLRDDNDDTEGGDLDLLKWNGDVIDKSDKAYFAGKSEIQNSKVNAFKTVKYKKNTFVIFLNTIDSLHGVTRRNVSENVRKFCVLTGGLNRSLYDKKLSKKKIILRFFKKILSLKKFY